MNILIYGAGAVGLGLASCLLKSNVTVDIVGRASTVAALQQEGLHRQGIFGEHHTPPSNFHVADSLEKLAPRRYDFILICTKSFDTASAAQSIASHPSLIGDSTRFVLCQNGWGNAEIFANTFPKDRIKNARVITGFIRPHKHTVNITVHADAIHLGSLFDENVDDLESLAKAIDSGGIPCQTTRAIGRDLWAKMLYNCMLNGLSTVFDVPYGLLGESEHTRDLMQTVAQEVFAVMQASGHQTHWPDVEQYLDAFYKQQLPSTYRHEPSMLQDVRAHKRTEIDSLNGAIVALGKQHNIPVPTNTLITRLVKFMESHPRPSS